jgi:hypothetical protein
MAHYQNNLQRNFCQKLTLTKIFGDTLFTKCTSTKLNLTCMLKLYISYHVRVSLALFINVERQVCANKQTTIATNILIKPMIEIFQNDMLDA